ncbi:MAG: hypothetical protein OXE84_00420 [Rhodobacteraceae bacterium]|nr:hypothetical protein [Paracoccaceae bacterium]MCY4196198.1 hypothetical protein [Paracoccaceae bacterium]MCY4326847.1 hypothetical protein [Paracoccaceae bacterium]
MPLAADDKNIIPSLRTKLAARTASIAELRRLVALQAERFSDLEQLLALNSLNSSKLPPADQASALRPTIVRSPRSAWA